jgi:hypothetical protein
MRPEVTPFVDGRPSEHVALPVELSIIGQIAVRSILKPPRFGAAGELVVPLLKKVDGGLILPVALVVQPRFEELK